MANELFTLEALNAKHGDALLLHYGTLKSPKVILIDGGPNGVFNSTIKPRLEALGKKRKQSPLRIEHTFVTHLDNDHIKGVLSFAEDILNSDAPAASCSSFWFNVFSDTMKALPPETASVLTTHTKPQKSLKAVTASIPEGQGLRDAAKKLKVFVNGSPFADKVLLVADKRGVKLNVGRGLSVTLVSPNKELLRKLAADWMKKVRPTAAETADYLDKSVYNLSSLVLIVEAKNAEGVSKRMLLTGDARGDHIVAGLEAGKFLEGGKAHFDLMKVCHHGSDRNLTAEFFQDITADNYVISADGRDENPSEVVLEWIARAAPTGYRVFMTNQGETGYPVLEKNITGATRKVKGLAKHLVFRKAGELSLCIDLFEPLAD